MVSTPKPYYEMNLETIRALSMIKNDAIYSINDRLMDFMGDRKDD